MNAPKPDKLAASATILHGSLKNQTETILRTLLSPGDHCALVDFPLHPNVGDSAIWLGTRNLLGEMDVSIDYTCDSQSFSENELYSRLPTGTILIQGGGNLGDLWPQCQQFREHIVRRFPQHRIIQLPQSLCFREQENLNRARAIFDAHPDLTLLLRDQRSFSAARQNFQARSLLCPDMAFVLTGLSVPRPPNHAVVWLSRRDHEAAGQYIPNVGHEVYRVNWAEDNNANTVWRHRRDAALRARKNALEGDPYRHGSCRSSTLLAAYDDYAALQVARGCELLGSGHSVITDRLHGHVLSILLKLPHVLLPDRYGKIRNLWQTWTKTWPDTHWANTPQEALQHATHLAGRLENRNPPIKKE